MSSYLHIIILLIVVMIGYVYYDHMKNYNKKKLTQIANDSNMSYEEYIKKNDITQRRVFSDIYLRCLNAKSNIPLFLSYEYDGVDGNNNKMYKIELSPNKNKKSKFWQHFFDPTYIRPQYQKLYKGDPSDALAISYEKKFKLNDIEFVTNDYNQNKNNFIELEQCNPYEYKLKTRMRSKHGVYSYLHIDPNGFGKREQIYFKEGCGDNVAKFTIDLIQLK